MKNLLKFANNVCSNISSYSYGLFSTTSGLTGENQKSFDTKFPAPHSIAEVQPPSTSLCCKQKGNSSPTPHSPVCGLGWLEVKMYLGSPSSWDGSGGDRKQGS